MNTPQTSRGFSDDPKLDWRLWANPNHVLNDPAMSKEEKRALLASWASDARAVTNYPALRQLESGHLVSMDNVLRALKRLDHIEEPPAPIGDGEKATSHIPKRGNWSRLSRLWRRSDDDDDPSNPAPAGLPPHPPMPAGAVAQV